MAAVKKELKAHNAYVAPELLQKLAETLSTSTYYHIEVIRDVEKAAEVLRLKSEIFSHSWAGSRGFEEKVTVVVCGQIELGEDSSYEYSNNGNSNGPTTTHKDGEFDMDEPFIFIQRRNSWDNMERSVNNYDDCTSTVVIYAPENIVDEAAYTAQRDAELAELCQLRYNLPKAE